MSTRRRDGGKTTFLRRRSGAGVYFFSRCFLKFIEKSFIMSGVDANATRFDKSCEKILG